MSARSLRFDPPVAKRLAHPVAVAGTMTIEHLLEAGPSHDPNDPIAAVRQNGTICFVNTVVPSIASWTPVSEAPSSIEWKSSASLPAILGMGPRPACRIYPCRRDSREAAVGRWSNRRGRKRCNGSVTNASEFGLWRDDGGTCAGAENEHYRSSGVSPVCFAMRLRIRGRAPALRETQRRTPADQGATVCGVIPTGA